MKAVGINLHAKNLFTSSVHVKTLFKSSTISKPTSMSTIRIIQSSSHKPYQVAEAGKQLNV